MIINGKKYLIWDCKIVVEDGDIPEGFDAALRAAACSAVDQKGFPVVCCFSGWSGKLNPFELEVFEEEQGRKKG